MMLLLLILHQRSMRGGASHTVSYQFSSVSFLPSLGGVEGAVVKWSLPVVGASTRFIIGKEEEGKDNQILLWLFWGFNNGPGPVLP